MRESDFKQVKDTSTTINLKLYVFVFFGEIDYIQHVWKLWNSQAGCIKCLV